MNQLKKIALIITLLFASAAAFALPAAPTECPSVANIKAKADNTFLFYDQGSYLAANISYFNTPYQWAFLIGPIKASSNKETDKSKEVKKKSLNLIQTIYGAPVPIINARGESRTCLYEVSGNYLAAAVTPVPPVPVF